MTSDENRNFPNRQSSDLAPLRPSKDSQVIPPTPPPPPSDSRVAPPPTTTDEQSDARRLLVAEYTRLKSDCMMGLYACLIFVCVLWCSFLVGPYRWPITRKTVFFALMAMIALCLVSTLCAIGPACFLYLLANGREDTAWEWSRKAIVEFIFRTHEANALFDRYREAAPRSQSQPLSLSNAKRELADEYVNMFADSVEMLIVAMFLLFIAAFPLLSGSRSGRVVVGLLVTAVMVTAFCLFRVMGSSHFLVLVAHGREDHLDTVREWSHLFFLSTARTESLFQRISSIQQQEEATNYHQV